MHSIMLCVDLVVVVLLVILALHMNRDFINYYTKRLNRRVVQAPAAASGRADSDKAITCLCGYLLTAICQLVQHGAVTHACNCIRCRNSDDCAVMKSKQT